MAYQSYFLYFLIQNLIGFLYGQLTPLTRVVEMNFIVEELPFIDLSRIGAIDYKYVTEHDYLPATIKESFRKAFLNTESPQFIYRPTPRNTGWGDTIRFRRSDPLAARRAGKDMYARAQAGRNAPVRRAGKEAYSPNLALYDHNLATRYPRTGTYWVDRNTGDEYILSGKSGSESKWEKARVPSIMNDAWVTTLDASPKQDFSGKINLNAGAGGINLGTSVNASTIRFSPKPDVVEGDKEYFFDKDLELDSLH